MNGKEYKKMFELEQIYWWFLARRELVEQLVRRTLASCQSGHGDLESAGWGGPRILDAGCGTGANLEMLGAYGETCGVDVSREALKFSGVRSTASILAGSLENLGFSEASFDLITALDVLEHIKDDRAAIRELNRVTRPGGRLIVTAPAYQFLWSEHDEALHHYRRYRRADLGRKLTEAGFEIEKLSYFMAFLLGPVLLFRIGRRLIRRRSRQADTSYIVLPELLNRFIVGLLGLERSLLSRMRLPFGVSILCVARKPLARQLEVARQSASDQISLQAGWVARQPAA